MRRNQRELIILLNSSAIWFCSTDHGIKILNREGRITSGDVPSLIFHRYLIVLAECSAEDDIGDVFKTMDPNVGYQHQTCVFYNVEKSVSTGLMLQEKSSHRSKGRVFTIAVPC